MIDNLGDVAGPLIGQGKTLVGNFLEALNLGFSNFLDNIRQHLLGGLTEWLLGKPITELNLKDTPGLLLRMLGVGWDQILGLVSAAAAKVIGPGALGAILSLVGEGSKFIDLGPGKWF